MRPQRNQGSLKTTTDFDLGPDLGNGFKHILKNSTIIKYVYINQSSNLINGNRIFLSKNLIN